MAAAAGQGAPLLGQDALMQGQGTLLHGQGALLLCTVVGVVGNATKVHALQQGQDALL